LVQTLAYQAEVTVPWLLLAAVSLVGVLLASSRPTEPVSLGAGIIRPFLAGARGAFRHRRARGAVVGVWLLGFVALAAVVAVARLENVAEFLRLDPAERRPGFAQEWIQTADWKLATGLVLGALITGTNRHPYRQAGFVLYGVLAALAAILWLRFGQSPNEALTLLGLAVGLAAAPLVSFALVWTEPRHHAVTAALMVGGVAGAGVVLAVLLNNLGEDPRAVRLPVLHVLLAVAAIGLLAGIASFFRPMLELTAEVLFWPMYRIRANGPGVDHLPVRGPCLVIGNHAAWFDPLFVAKVLPAPVTPMMTSRFYDLPVLSWLMRHVVGTIRVPDKAVRHEAPELREAVAALDRGECIVLFPEGYLRRKEEVPLRRFGRGAWQILRDRPGTPVFACWIEGTWGSYLSFRGGPPAKGKRPDVWRSIRIGMVGPVPIDPATLKDHMATRLYLMQQVSEARRPLGLEPLNLTTAHEAEGDGE
jgi:1-acyl-sn-glycerol-3-phosphate acyltransferase